MAIRHTDIAPTTFSIKDLCSCISSYTEGARALGFWFSNDPTANDRGCAVDTYLDNDSFQALLTAAIEDAKEYAKSNKLFFNSDKLADTVIDLLADAWTAGFTVQF